MDDPPLQKIAISGPTLASIIQRFSTSPSAFDGLLFSHVTHVIPLNFSDDSATPAVDSSTLLATVTGFLCSSTFHDFSGAVQLVSLRRLIHHRSSLLCWFSGRQKTPLRPSMREFSVTIFGRRHDGLNGLKYDHLDEGNFEKNHQF